MTRDLVVPSGAVGRLRTTCAEDAGESHAEDCVKSVSEESSPVRVGPPQALRVEKPGSVHAVACIPMRKARNSTKRMMTAITAAQSIEHRLACKAES